MLKLGDDYIKYDIKKIEPIRVLLVGTRIYYYGKLIMKKGVLLNYILTN